MPSTKRGNVARIICAPKCQAYAVQYSSVLCMICTTRFSETRDLTASIGRSTAYCQILLITHDPTSGFQSQYYNAEHTYCLDNRIQTLQKLKSSVHDIACCNSAHYPPLQCDTQYTHTCIYIYVCIYICVHSAAEKVACDTETIHDSRTDIVLSLTRCYNTPICIQPR